MFFVTEDGGLTTAGYVLTAVAVFALLIVISALANKNKKVSAKQLAFAAVASPSSDTGTVRQSGSWPVLHTACCR